MSAKDGMRKSEEIVTEMRDLWEAYERDLMPTSPGHSRLMSLWKQLDDLMIDGCAMPREWRRSQPDQ